MENSFAAHQMQEQEQVQILSPRMLQSLRVLQMPSTELYDYLMKELEENPVITFDSIDYAEKCRRNSHYATDDNNEAVLADIVADDDNSPIMSLRLQFAMLRPSLEIEHIGYALIYLLDENGYLYYDDVERLAQASNISLNDLKTALDLLRSLEPAGVGAFNPRECILLQLERKGLKDSDAWKIAQDHLELLGKNQLPQIARKTGLPLQRVVSAQQLIKTLDPKPLMMETRHRGSGYIAPDIRIFKREKGFAVELNQLRADSIMIDDTYSKIYKETDNETVRTFLYENMKKAQWLRDSIRQRCETLMDCASQLLNSQRAFFESGPDYLLPFSRKELAERIVRSESTVSRALKDKYVECDWGLFPTDYFFPKPTAEAHPTMTKNSIENSIQSIILGEDRQSPLSDGEIAESLKRLGISVSRRTVAKYRDELGIPASSRRRVYS
ncbi:MAG: RNA polymerase factor sigma-54 [Oscillospiraceae bacterium]|nr:RNA polymerase factor sigma-54 [Oscillospiraceae bacterium]